MSRHPIAHGVATTSTRLLLTTLTAIPLSVANCAADPSSPPRVATAPIFEDFLGPAGSSPNPDLWVADTGSSAENGWEQGSLQDYTDAADNIRLDGHGSLIIEARRSGDDYTSGRLVTRAKVSFPFGTVSARIKFPAGQGIWPAFWMLGSDIDSVGWPQCGEVDIMELTGTGTEYHVSLHGPKLDIGISSQPTGNLTEDFHTYWVTRHRDDMRIGVDDTTLGAFTPSALPPGAEWVFNGPMFVLLNVAVGGDWPGPPDRSTRFPATMVVDWFRFDPSSR